MRVTTWKRVGLAAAVVAVSGTLAATGRVAGLAGGATAEPLSGEALQHGCLPGQAKPPLLAYAQSLSYGTLRGSGDNQVLWWLSNPADPNSFQAGPEGRILPEDNSHTGMLDAAGRIVAKVWIEGGHGQAGYPKLNLPEGWSYIKICRTTTPNKLWALVIPESPLPLRPHPNVREHTPPRTSPVAKALWEWDPRDDHMCMTCAQNMWCELY